MKNFFWLFMLYVSISFSQQTKIDSIKTILEATSSPLEIAKLNTTLAGLYERVDIEEGKAHAYRALAYTGNDSLQAAVNNQLGRFHFFTAQLDSASIYFEKTKELHGKLNNPERVAAVNISLGAIQLRQGDYNKTIKTLTESASFFEEVNDSINMAKCYSNLASAFAELNIYPKAIEYSEKALGIFRNTNQTQFELITLPNLATQYYKNGDTIQAIQYNAEAEELASKLDDKRSLSIIYNNLGDLFLLKDPVKAKAYLEKTLQLKNELKLVKGIEITQSNLGFIHLQNKEYSKAIRYFNEALTQVKGKQRVSVYNNLKDAYKGIGNIQMALLFSEKSKHLNDSILNTESENNYLEIQTKYETEKKEKEILSLKTVNQESEYKRITNRNYFIAALAAFLITLVVVYLIIRNSKKKQVIALQKEEIKTQLIEQELKTQELNGIDAIISAQEAERSKMAADLHDNLGSKVATLKLYIESFEEQDGFDQFHEKVKNLTAETYDEIRKVAKNKNFGAQISKGLIPSTEAIAAQISDASKLDIKVLNVDVENRIENSIEIQIFRIIQELLTNIIKHANAKEVVIQFSEHTNMLNIIVEDDGRGFNPSNPSNGIGLYTVESRVEKIGGNLVIDSSEGNGTTIIINIPI